MNSQEQKVSGIVGTIFLWTYIAILVSGIICLVVVPDKYEKIRMVSGFLVYGTGLPLVVVSFLYYSQRRGWLKTNEPENR
jgi:hypothetical protein